MKKLVLFLVLATSGLGLSAQNAKASSDPGTITSYHTSINAPIHQVNASGKCLVSITRSGDTNQYIEVIALSGDTLLHSSITVNGDKLDIRHSDPAVYRIFLSKDSMMFYSDESKGAKIILSPDEVEAVDELVEMAQEGVPPVLFKGLTRLMLASDNFGFSADDTSDSGKGKKDKSQYDRTNFDFHWGFNNWGDNPFNGLVGMSDPGYDLRTSFSSHQLSYNYSYVMTEHFNMSVGVGYESDVYKFNTPYVDYSNGAFSAQDIAAANGYYSTRFITRYVQLPLGIGWRAHGDGDGLNLRLYAVPGLGWCGKHTGLKHELHKEGTNDQDQTNLKDAINPYKMDVRLEITGGFMGMYLQVATLPLFVEGVKIYPIKIGFML